jgi:hypothetical protein
VDHEFGRPLLAVEVVELIGPSFPAGRRVQSCVLTVLFVLLVESALGDGSPLAVEFSEGGRQLSSGSFTCEFDGHIEYLFEGLSFLVVEVQGLRGLVVVPGPINSS